MKRAVFLLALGASALPSGARAFSDPQLFADETQTGGGGGRFFTGSPLDGYTCSVCHRGGPTPHIRVFGFPQAYQPGETYEVEIRWDEPDLPHGLNVELVNQTGEDMNVRLVSESKVGKEGRCDRSQTGDVAATLMKSGNRRIVAVSDCGAESARFRFDAPSRASLALSAGLVRADGSEDAEGDGVLAERRIAQPGNALVLDSGATCAVRGRTSRGAALALPALICGLMWRRRRAARLT